MSARSGGVRRPLGRLTANSFCGSGRFRLHSKLLHMVLLVYVVLFDTNGAYNRWGSRIDLGGNLKIDFGATGWFPNATEVDMCSLH